MLQLSSACLGILAQLENAVERVSAEDFCRPLETLGGSSIGQHVRHTVEFFLCLEKGFESGVINYDKRDHDKQIETDRMMAIRAIRRIRDFVDCKAYSKELILEVSYDLTSDEYLQISSTYFRELVYTIEHAIHHMAIIKIGVREIGSFVELPFDFGVAISTLRYNESVNVK